MDHIRLLCDLSELNWVFKDVTSIDRFLQKTVEMVSRHMAADVCSVYLYDDFDKTLVLKATVGLNPEYVNQVRLAMGEGLTGLAVKEMRPICERTGSEHPGYKFFQGLLEEHFDAFLAVPLLRGVQKVGALVVQRKSNGFDEHDVAAMRAVSGQLANAIEHARALIVIEKAKGARHSRHGSKETLFHKGKTAAPGFAFAPAAVYEHRIELDEFRNRDYQQTYTAKDFETALQVTIEELEQYQDHLAHQLDDIASLIFAAHLLMLKDDQFTGKMRSKILEGVSPPEAILSIADEFIAAFSAQQSAYMQEKADDVRDICLRLIRHLVSGQASLHGYAGHITLARGLLPSDMLILFAEGVKGIVLVGGGITSHVAVLSRSLGIPMIIADNPDLLDTGNPETILLDGELGNVYFNPSEEVVEPFRNREAARTHSEQTLSTLKDQSRTADNERIRLFANINLLTDTKAALSLKAEGVGLYRTEFPFIIRNTFPSEEEQVVIYGKLVERMSPRGPIIFRTLDIGGDKELSYTDNGSENNPFLGLRSIRFTLENRDIFKQQLRAILRAGHEADIGIMFPMISSLDEYLESREVLSECLEELKVQGLPHNDTPRSGIMVELPGVVDIIESFADKVDFMSIGTNDLIQYTLAVDRTNERVAKLYQPHHPAILRSIRRIAEAASQHDIQLSVCGDMAHEPRYIPFLIGIGIRALSIEPLYLPQIQTTVEATTTQDARRLADRLLECSTIAQAGAILDENNR